MPRQQLPSEKIVSRRSFLRQTLTLPGRYHLETIVPGEYPGQPVLTTQLYFPAEPRNTTDSIFSPELLMQVQNTPNGQLATFNFVLALS